MRRKIKQIGALFLTVLVVCVSGVTVIYAGHPEDKGLGGTGEAAEKADEEPEAQEESGKASDPQEPEEPEAPQEPEEPQEPQEPEEPEEPETPKDPGPEEKEEDKTAPVIKKYEIKVPGPDGEAGFYRTVPEVKLTHVSACGITCYKVKRSKGKAIRGEIKKQGQSVTLGRNQLDEGKNTLTVWMEDGGGKKVKNMTSQYVFMIDTVPPGLEVTVPGSFDDWYPDRVTVTARAKDASGQVSFVTASVSNKQIGKVKGDKGSFTVTQASVDGAGVEVTVTAQDRAGNQTSVSRKVYVDAAPPEIEISGAKDYTIVGHPVSLTYKVKEENAFGHIRAWAEWESVEGKKKVLKASDFKTKKGKKTATQKLTGNGIYRVHVKAEDRAGHTNEAELQVLIDQENPVIRHVKELEGRQMQSFCWNYTRDEMIRDFTTFTYEIRLDGQLYHRGNVIHTEGKHTLEVTARDAAGNKERAAADFVIDHTAPGICFDRIEDGASYDGPQTFLVYTENEADQISKIRMNGTVQKKVPSDGKYELTAEENGKYTVDVQAKDAAGNTSERRISFEIVPKETLAGKIKTPIRRLFTGEEQEESPSDPAEKKSAGISAGKIAAGALAAAVFLLAGFFLYRKRKKK